jgi:hypothetical protein
MSKRHNRRECFLCVLSEDSCREPFSVWIIAFITTSQILSEVPYVTIYYWLWINWHSMLIFWEYVSPDNQVSNWNITNAPEVSNELDFHFSIITVLGIQSEYAWHIKIRQSQYIYSTNTYHKIKTFLVHHYLWLVQSMLSYHHHIIEY